MCILWWHNEYQLCKNRPRHENKEALKISRWGTYFDKLKKAAACCPHKCNFQGQHAALLFKLSQKVPHLEIFNTASQVKNWQFSQNVTCDSALKCDMWQINYGFFAWYGLNKYKSMLCNPKIMILSSLKGFYFFC